MGAKELALANEILRGVVGSTAYGTAVDGQDDRDEMGIFIEPPDYVCGLRSCDHYIYRDQPNGARSQPGDLDLTLYSLRKFARLAAQGNPSILVLLWLPDYIHAHPLAEELLAIRGAFVSREAGERFLGYLVSQKLRLTGQRKKDVTRHDLVERYGFDTKYAMHALRLAYQGIEYVSEGRINLPIPAARLTTLRAVRCGEVKFGDAVSLINEAEQSLRSAIETCHRKANLDLINSALVRMHRKWWETPPPSTPSAPDRSPTRQTTGSARP